MKKVSSSSRILKGFAAAAVCAVFACGCSERNDQQQIGMNESSAAHSGTSESISDSAADNLQRENISFSGDIVKTDTLHINELIYHCLDSHFTGTNFLGGKGSLHIPVYGKTALWYDDTNYYLPDGYFPCSGNQLMPISTDSELANLYQTGRIFSDSHDLFIVKDGTVNQVDNSGTLTPFFRFADAGLPDDTLLTFHASRVGGRIMFPCCSNDSAAYVWTDKNGTILGSQSGLPANTWFSDSGIDDGNLYAYYMDFKSENVIHRIVPPDCGEMNEDVTLPGYSCNAANNLHGVEVTDDIILYFDCNGNYCRCECDGTEYKVLWEADTPESNALRMHLAAVFDGMVYYALTDPLSEKPMQTDIMQYDLFSGETTKLVSFDKSLFSDDSYISCYSGKLLIDAGNDRIWYDPKTKELFQMLT